MDNDSGLQMRFYETGPDEVTAEYEVPDRYQGYPGVVHGGIVAAMLDEVAGRAQMGDDPPRFMYTARLNIRYRKHVPTDELLRIVGRIDKRRGRTTIATGVIYGPEGELLAEAEALLVDMPSDVLQSTDLDALGWQVYEEG
ncbi:PaaI family thioesterase [Chloroflexota bacterium]